MRCSFIALKYAFFSIPNSPTMIQFSFKKHTLQFNFAAKTSRGTLNTHNVFYIFAKDVENNLCGIGEAAPLVGLSLDDRDDFEAQLAQICLKISGKDNEAAILKEIVLPEFPSVYFAVETALADLKNGGRKIIFDNAFANKKASLPINGLVWMSEIEAMRTQAEQKIAEGFDCIKFKIGALNYDNELQLLIELRKKYGDKITLRVDANGAFSFAEAKKVLLDLKKLDVHSIEQPIATEHWDEMSELCSETPVPIALDEELIGIFDSQSKFTLLEYIAPQFIILKPTLLGGFAQTNMWIKMAKSLKINFWLTSALESNIGLNAIAQYTAEVLAKEKSVLPQGLGTGSLYTNNIFSPLEVRAGQILINEAAWQEV